MYAFTRCVALPAKTSIRIVCSVSEEYGETKRDENDFQQTKINHQNAEIYRRKLHAAIPASQLRNGDARVLAFTDLQNERFAKLKHQRLIADFLAIQLDPALLDHAHGL